MSSSHRLFTGHLRFFRVFGFCLLESNSKWPISILNLGNIIGELVLLYLCYHSAKGMFDFSHTIGLIVDVLQIVAPIITHLVCLIDCLCQKRRHEQIWQGLMQLLDDGGMVLSPIKKTLNRYFLTVTIAFLLCTAIEAWIMLRASFIWFRSRAVGEWAFMSCRAAFLYYILHVVIVGSIIRMIVAELRYAASDSKSQLKSSRVEMEQQTILMRVAFCRKCYERLYRISLEMSYCFGWSLICHLMYNFMDITIALYYNYRRVVLGVLNAGEKGGKGDGGVHNGVNYNYYTP